MAVEDQLNTQLDDLLGKALASALFHLDESADPEDVDKKTVQLILDRAGEEGLTVLAAEGLWRLGVNVPQADVERFRKKAMARALILERDRGRITQAFTEAHIPHLFFKGALMDPVFFGSVGRRDCTDIDVLVAPENKMVAKALLMGLGWKPLAFANKQASKKKSPGWEYRWTGAGLGMDVDLHVGLTKAPYNDPARQVLLRQRTYQAGRTEIIGPSIEDLLLVSACNLAPAKFVGARFKQAADAAMVLEIYQVDWDALVKRTQKAKVGWALWALLRLAVARFESRVPSSFLAEIAPPLPQQMLVEWAVGIKEAPHIPDHAMGRLLLEWPLSQRGLWGLQASGKWLGLRAKDWVLEKWG